MAEEMAKVTKAALKEPERKRDNVMAAIDGERKASGPFPFGNELWVKKIK